MASAVSARPPARAAERTDHQLVSAVRRGDDRAFEQLYSRYQRRIAAYAYRMVRDYGRAEDITQDVFVSALRRMRQTERAIAFKPWIYEIAKNACIDAHRRGRRTEEISYDAGDRLSASDHVRLVATGPEPDAAVDAKQELDYLCGAFGGLSESHHEILVLRELEGLSYKDIGERLGISRPAVESTLFRARKRLGEEYDELASGARCLRIQGIVADGGAGLGLRDRRRLNRHLAHCQPCRRLAARAGFDLPVPLRRRVAEKLGALLPLPAFLRFRRGGEGEPTSSSGAGGAWAMHVPSIAEAMSSGWGKGVAGLAALLLAGGAGVTTFKERDARGAGRSVPEARTASDGATTPRRSIGSVRDRRAVAARPRGSGAERGGAGRSGGEHAGRSSASTGADAPVGGPSEAGSPPVSAPSQGAPGTDAPKLPAIGAPGVGAPGVQAPDVNETTQTVTGAVPEVGGSVPTAVPEVPVDAPDPGQVVPQVPDPGEVVPEVPAPVEGAVDGATGGLPNP
ncbi:MAG TPA: sigma-70 family RNA polymerase sigma factor [Solirubrobacteraceae bacterium]|nr:sigma-70 family RNA polymerase sigma factor [Solirubrobacteraceae bacterium]